MVEVLVGLTGVLATALTAALIALARLRTRPDATNKLVENEMKHVREDIAALSGKVDQLFGQLEERVRYLERR